MKKKIALCVAEKPSVAKSVADFLSGGRCNKVNEFDIYITKIPYIVQRSIKVQSNI